MTSTACLYCFAVFRYQRGDHNVIAVSQEQYRNCTSPSPSTSRSDILASGNDVIRLEEAGTKWYICGLPLHCQADQRLAVTVLATPVAIPSPSPSPQPTNPPRSGSANAGICNKRSWSGLCLLLLLLIHTLF